MQYNVAQLLKEPIGASRSYRVEQSFTGVPGITDRVCGQLDMLRTHQGILVNAKLDIESTLICSRCIGEFTRPSTPAHRRRVLSYHRPSYGAQPFPTGRRGGGVAYRCHAFIRPSRSIKAVRHRGRSHETLVPPGLPWTLPALRDQLEPGTVRMRCRPARPAMGRPSGPAGQIRGL